VSEFIIDENIFEELVKEYKLSIDQSKVLRNILENPEGMFFVLHRSPLDTDQRLKTLSVFLKYREKIGLK